MSTFEATQGMLNQRHFEVLEIDLPVITGTCTIGGNPGTGTPLTCDQDWATAGSEYKTYYFTNENAPILPSINGEPIYRLIKSISETATELKPGDGLSSRSSLSVVLTDITGQDPNNLAPGVTLTVKNQGTYLGKLSARQIFENKNARLKLYRVEPDGSIDLVNGAQTRSFLTDTLTLNKNGTWNLACKDLLSLVNLGEKTWPIKQGSALGQGSFVKFDITDSVLVIDVDEFTDYSAAKVIRIGDEFLQVTVSGNQTGSAQLTTTSRGAAIIAPISGEVLTTTIASSHSAGDEVFICDVSDNETIDSLLTRVLTDSDFPVGLIPATDWADEVEEWHTNDKINTLHSESESVNDVINRILTGFLMDLWFDVAAPDGGRAILSAISVHKQSTSLLTEGKEINAYSIKKIAKDGMRATRALVVYDKKNLADSDDQSNFKKGSQYSDNRLVSPEFYTKHKDKHFDNNFLIGTDSANLLVQRYVSRFKFTPIERPFTTDERYLTFDVGDIVDLATSVDQSIFGMPSGNIRGQITKITPKYKGGRTYEVKALTYEAAFDSGTEIVLDTPLVSVNLYILAGAPSQPIDLTFILDGVNGNDSSGVYAISAGGFASGSKLTIIMVNGFDGQAAGGWGGEGSSNIFFPGFPGWNNGFEAGVVYNAGGVDTDIYLSGATPSAAYPVADGYMRSPGGGGGAGQYIRNINVHTEGGGGGGGAGKPPGQGGFGYLTRFTNIQAGGGDSFGQGGDGGDGASAGDVSGGSGGGINVDGEDGESSNPAEFASTGGGGGGGGWGGNGGDGGISSTPDGFQAPQGLGGLAGAAVLDGGATVKVFGSTAARFINGDGDDPIISEPNQLTNGDFSNGTTDWASRDGAGLSVTSNVMEVTDVTGSGGSAAIQVVNLIAGETYIISCEARKVTGGNPALLIEWGAGGDSKNQGTSSTSFDVISYEFTPLNTTGDSGFDYTLNLREDGTNAGDICEFKNVSLARKL